MSRASLTIVTLGVLVAGSAHAQASHDAAAPEDSVIRLTPVTVTATRSATNVFRVPAPVSVLDRRAITERMPTSISDLFRGMPGLDVSGVGASQVRPIIRGQRGQRILLLSDGLRLNNSRRQQDFGELPALVDVSAVERIEVVRGPSSVLYGSDAIGGVVNVITKRPDEDGIHGTAGVRYNTLDASRTGFGSGVSSAFGSAAARFGRLSIMARGNRRNTANYAAPAGTFGDITLDDAVKVHDSGVKDYSFDGYLGYQIARGHDAFVRYEQFGADTAGFGYLDPELFGPDEPLIRIRYPRQQYRRMVGGYNSTALGLPVADQLDVTGYYQTNVRNLSFDIFIPFGGGAGMAIDQRNFTEIQTVGGRLEAKKFLGSAAVLTYGVDFFRDVTDNTDTSTTSYVGIPVPPSTVDIPQVPNASYRSMGAFAQSEFDLTPWATVILGARYQEVHAATRTTPGIDDALVASTDRTLVASANAVVTLSDKLSAVASAGRAFRSPNLVERFFNGATPEGFGYQSANPDLQAETSLNVDLGLRYRDRILYVEGFVFQNTIFNGIRIDATGDTKFGLTEYHNVNVDRLRVRGFELQWDVRSPTGIAVGSGFTHLRSRNVTLDQDNPIGDGFASQMTAFARYDLPSRHAFVQYDVRYNFERDDPEIMPGTPIGETLPAFMVHDIRAGVVAFRYAGQTGQFLIAVNNLTNALYAEFANASFFRPEPRRNIVVSYVHSF
ncbi:MAG TPA: TonB-dependent receptor [Gemmatimonadales bacterium]